MPAYALSVTGHRRLADKVLASSKAAIGASMCGGPLSGVFVPGAQIASGKLDSLPLLVRSMAGSGQVLVQQRVGVESFVSAAYCLQR